MVQLLDDVDNFFVTGIYLVSPNYTSDNFRESGPHQRLDKCDKISLVPFKRKFVSPQHSSWHELTGNTNKTSAF
jgi:hypothetical protein